MCEGQRGKGSGASGGVRMGVEGEREKGGGGCTNGGNGLIVIAFGIYVRFRTRLWKSAALGGPQPITKNDNKLHK